MHLPWTHGRHFSTAGLDTYLARWRGRRTSQARLTTVRPRATPPSETVDPETAAEIDRAICHLALVRVPEPLDPWRELSRLALVHSERDGLDGDLGRIALLPTP